MAIAQPARAAFGRIGAAAGLGCLATLLAAGPVLAEPLRIALVVGNGAYAAAGGPMPVPACPDSARAVGAALRGQGFEVTERLDATRSVADAAMAGFARKLRDEPGSIGVAYVCGRASEFNGRAFLLPVSANPARDSDVLTQGLLARLLPDALSRGAVRSGFVAFDVVPAAGPADLPAFAALAEAAAASGVALVVARPADDTAPGPTPLAAALRTGLAAPAVTPAALVEALRREVPGATLLAARLPGSPLPPLDLPPPDAPAPSAAAPPVPEPAAPEPAVAAAPVPPPATLPPAAATPPAVAMPEEGRMTEADRRRVQAALARLGYYADRVDGRFGPGTRAAIRRFQFELKAEMTGVLTAEQATRLVDEAS
ncbi:peptidoglycan-binding protein [Roseomonas sp. OT10]|uniref:peptidoglycan-binding domain-containing protein n=1 Tax=Roseomonas cutis TaxID=2897332 RepID=UPI001E47984E|nr:peptidoglycan-binding domain-containing protein [Roseomonas sp. OT10]UFN50501.1 peptidoglycan-binding protein [Roseomonas sp. OT10]